MATKHSLSVGVYYPELGKTVQKTITDINPYATHAAITTFAEYLNHLVEEDAGVGSGFHGAAVISRNELDFHKPTAIPPIKLARADYTSTWTPANHPDYFNGNSYDAKSFGEADDATFVQGGNSMHDSSYHKLTITVNVDDEFSAREIDGFRKLSTFEKDGKTYEQCEYGLYMYGQGLATYSYVTPERSAFGDAADVSLLEFSDFYALKSSECWHYVRFITSIAAGETNDVTLVVQDRYDHYMALVITVRFVKGA